MITVFHLGMDSCISVFLDHHAGLAEFRETEGGEHSYGAAAYDEDIGFRGDFGGHDFRLSVEFEIEDMGFDGGK